MVAVFTADEGALLSMLETGMAALRAGLPDDSLTHHAKARVMRGGSGKADCHERAQLSLGVPYSLVVSFCELSFTDYGGEPF